MHIQLMTGAIGSGKTAQVVSLLKFDDQYKGRFVYHHSITWTGKNDPGTRVFCDSPNCLVCPDDPAKATGLKAKDWHTWAEPNSILLFDECHFVWPRRDKSANVPPGIDALTRLRHNKLTMFLLTPHPMKLDVDARRAATIHYHFSRTGLGRKCKVFDEHQDDPANAYGGEATFAPIPKKTFGMYVSSESGHTKVKRKLPRKLVATVALVLTIFTGLFFFASPFDDAGRLGLVSQAADVTVNPGTPASDGLTGVLQDSFSAVGASVSGGYGGSGSSPMFTAPDYETLLDAVPVIPGYPETAPMYSHLVNDIRPSELPKLSGCIRAANQKRCDCYDQAGKKYQTTVQRCEAFLEGRDRGRISPALVTGP